MTSNATRTARSALISPWMVVLIFCLVYLGLVFFANQADPEVFVTLGDCYASCAGRADCDLNKDEGYDGQFTYYIARDPANAAPCLDVPAYRYQRILLPVLGRLLAFGQEAWIPPALVTINLAALVVSTALLSDLLAGLRANRWYALVYGLFVGLVISVRLSTTEPLAYGLVVLALWWEQRERPGWAALAFLLAALAKETTLAFVAGCLLYDVLERRWRHALTLLLVVGLPFALWQAALYLWLGAFGAGSGGAGNSPFEIIPFNGFWRVAYDASSSLAVFLLFSLYTIPGVILPSVWGMWTALRELWRAPRHEYAGLLLVNAALMAFVPFSTYREPLGLFRFLVGLVLSHLLYAALRFPRRRPLRYSWLWLALLYYLAAG